MTGHKPRGQFSLEAMIMLAAYFAFVALMVSAVSGQARQNKVADGGRDYCMALFSVSQEFVAANFSGLGESSPPSCNASLSGGSKALVAAKDWR